VIARDHYGGAGVFGALEIISGVGAVIGSVTAARWRPAHPLFTGFMLALAWPLMAGTFAVGAPVALVAVFAFGTGFGFSQLMIWWETALARYIPPAALSRVSAWDWMGSLALLPLGYLIAGPLASAVGARTVLGVGGVIGFVLLVIGALPRETRELRGPASGDGMPRGLPEQRPGQIRVETRGEPQVAHVDPLVLAVDERRRFE
jgi:MFS family permease